MKRYPRFSLPGGQSPPWTPRFGAPNRRKATKMSDDTTGQAADAPEGPGAVILEFKLPEKLMIPGPKKGITVEEFERWITNTAEVTNKLIRATGVLMENTKVVRDDQEKFIGLFSEGLSGTVKNVAQLTGAVAVNTENLEKAMDALLVFANSRVQLDDRVKRLERVVRLLGATLAGSFVAGMIAIGLLARAKGVL